jgi:hypothetical protein
LSRFSWISWAVHHWFPVLFCQWIKWHADLNVLNRFFLKSKLQYHSFMLKSFLLIMLFQRLLVGSLIKLSESFQILKDV